MASKLQTNLEVILNEKNTKILPENIKQGVEIFGVMGTYTSDATATAEDVLKGKTAYVNGEKIVGTFEVGSGTGEYNASMNNSITGGTNSSLIHTLIKKLPEDLVMSGTNANYMFYNCSSLEEIPETFKTSSCISASYFAYGCTNLKHVPRLSFAKVQGTNCQEMFGGCPNLTEESLDNILYGCSKMTQTSQAYRTLKTIGLTEEQATICKTLSNWNECVLKFWTTGY